MIFDQTCAVPIGIDRLWDFMIDAAAVSACMPGLESFTETSPDEYAGRVRIKVGPIALRMEGKVAVIERDRPTWTARMTAEGRDHRVPGGVKVRMTMVLARKSEQETELNVVTDATVLGKLGEFGQPIMKKSADRILQQFVQNIVDELGRPSAAAG